MIAPVDNANSGQLFVTRVARNGTVIVEVRKPAPLTRTLVELLEDMRPVSRTILGVEVDLAARPDFNVARRIEKRECGAVAQFKAERERARFTRKKK